jgi:hypothetical protein
MLAARTKDALCFDEMLRGLSDVLASTVSCKFVGPEDLKEGFMEPLGSDDLDYFRQTRSLRWCADTMLVSTCMFTIFCCKTFILQVIGSLVDVRRWTRTAI